MNPFVKIVFIGLLVLFGAPSSTLAENEENRADLILLEGAGVATQAAMEIEEQYEARKKKYGISGDFFESQRQIFIKSSGGPVMSSLGVDMLAIRKNAYAQALHFLMSILIIMLAFLKSANPTNRRDINDSGAILSRFFVKVAVGILVISGTPTLYATAITLKNATAMIASYALAGSDNINDTTGGTLSDRYKERQAFASDERLASFLATQRGITDAVNDTLKAIVGDDPEPFMPLNSAMQDYYSELEDYTLSYFGLLGQNYNGQKKFGADTFSQPINFAETTSRQTAIDLLKENIADVLISHASLPETHQGVSLQLPANYYYKKNADQTRSYYRSAFYEVDADFRAKLQPAYIYREKLLNDYKDTMIEAERDASNKSEFITMNETAAKSLRTQLMSSYYEQVYTTTYRFIEDSLGEYLKNTPHADYVIDRFTTLGSAAANIELPGQELNAWNEKALVVRNFCQRITIWVGFTLFEAVIEISIFLLWMTYPLWFLEATSKAFIGRAKNIYILCLNTAVLIFMLGLVEAMAAELLYMVMGGGIADYVSSGGGIGATVGGWVVGGALKSVGGALSLVFLTTYVVALGLCIYLTPKITRAIFAGTSIVGTLAGGMLSAGMAGAAVGVAAATGGAGLTGAGGAMSNLRRRFTERGAMGKAPSLTQGIASLPKVSRGGGDKHGAVSSAILNKNASPIARIAKNYQATGTAMLKESSMAIASGGDPNGYFQMRKSMNQKRNGPNQEDAEDQSEPNDALPPKVKVR